MTKAPKIDARLDRIYSATGDKRQMFDDWAANYDHDLIDDLGYVADAETCRHLIDRVSDKSSRILDAGCGTGLVGRRLQQAGYDQIDGSDYAAKMLRQAEATGAYRRLWQHDLTQAYRIERPYDAAIAVGVFSFSVPSAEHLVNITDCLRPGGFAFITVNGKAWREVDWPAKIERLDLRAMGARIIDTVAIDYLTAEGIDGRLLIFQRN